MRRALWIGLFAGLLLASCSEPPSWTKLIEGKISEQYPDYKVVPTEGGGLVVQRPGAVAVPVDVNAIAQFCQRGPKDCNYAIDQMLLELRK